MKSTARHWLHYWTTRTLNRECNTVWQEIVKKFYPPRQTVAVKFHACFEIFSFNFNNDHIDYNSPVSPIPRLFGARENIPNPTTLYIFNLYLGVH